MAKSEKVEISVGGRQLHVSNLGKPMYPKVGFTKGDVIDYYARIGRVMVPHLLERPITLKRYPDGIDSKFFYEKNCPTHRPQWLRTVEVATSSKVINYCLVDDLAGLVWMANMASIEIHPFLALGDDILRPTKVTFDLDPGPPAGVVQCCRVALRLREMLGDLGLEVFPKTSGSKGMQVEVPLNTPTTYNQTKPFARATAQLMEARYPADVVSRMDKSLRGGKVFIDWSQNDDAKTTVSVYSLRAKDEPTVSSPVTWDEVAQGAEGRVLSFTSAEVLARVEEMGDLQEPVLSLSQTLPALGV